MFRLKIDSTSSVPIYSQLIHAIKVELISERLKPGDRLPTLVEMATMLKLNPNTVLKSYKQLQREGLIVAKGRNGYSVSAKKTDFDSFKEALLRDEFMDFIDRAVVIGARKSKIRELMEQYLETEAQ